MKVYQKTEKKYINLINKLNKTFDLNYLQILDRFMKTKGVLTVDRIYTSMYDYKEKLTGIMLGKMVELNLINILLPKGKAPKQPDSDILIIGELGKEYYNAFLQKLDEMATSNLIDDTLQISIKQLEAITLGKVAECSISLNDCNEHLYGGNIRTNKHFINVATITRELKQNPHKFGRMKLYDIADTIYPGYIDVMTHIAGVEARKSTLENLLTIFKDEMYFSKAFLQEMVNNNYLRVIKEDGTYRLTTKGEVYINRTEKAIRKLEVSWQRNTIFQRKLDRRISELKSTYDLITDECNNYDKKLEDIRAIIDEVTKKSYE